MTIFQSFPLGDRIKCAQSTFNPWAMEPLAFHAIKIRFHEEVTLAISMEQGQYPKTELERHGIEKKNLLKGNSLLI